MNLIAIGCSFRSAPVEIRERLAFDPPKINKALLELNSRFGCETVILSTCNRVELYLAKLTELPPNVDSVSTVLSELHNLPAQEIRPLLYEHRDTSAVRHLFRVTASLDSMIVGEGQIAKQVREAFDASQQLGTTGLILNTLFVKALEASKRARSQTGIADGHVSVSSVGVDFVREVFDHFHDKTVLLIGAGKMGRLTLKHLRELSPQKILVINRSPEKAQELAKECNGQAVPWSQLDDVLVHSDIVLSTTDAKEPIMTRSRFDAIHKRRRNRTIAILDIAVPRDFDPTIGEINDTFLFNIDDLKQLVDQNITQRKTHIGKAEMIVEEERKKFIDDWARRRNGPLIRQLMEECDEKRKAVMEKLFGKLNGKLSDPDKQQIEYFFNLFQKQLLHGPINALSEASKEGSSANLVEAIRKLFRLNTNE
jgi:glutamyl-tRNA reductase